MTPEARLALAAEIEKFGLLQVAAKVPFTAADVIVAALRALPVRAQEPTSESIARLINPELFVEYDLLVARGTLADNGKPWANVVFGLRIKRLIEKADAIKALYAAPPPSGERLTSDAAREEGFNEGVEHTVMLLAKWLGAEGWSHQDGSEDYDTDLGNTLLDILAAKGLYDKDTAEFLTTPAPSEASKVREALKNAARDIKSIHEKIGERGLLNQTAAIQTLCRSALDEIERVTLAAQPPVADGVREALDLLQLQQRGRARALRILNAHRVVSDPITVAQADAYEECGNELRAALTPPSSGGETER